MVCILHLNMNELSFHWTVCVPNFDFFLLNCAAGMLLVYIVYRPGTLNTGIAPWLPK